MTKKEIIEAIKAECDKVKQHKYDEFFCGMTNNVTRRGREHKAKILYHVKILNKEYCNELLSDLSDLGFDIGNQRNNGQDDSLWIYVYQKTPSTIQYLKASFILFFNKRWYSEEKYDEAPESEGIYMCVACDKEKKEDKIFQPHKLIYIGMTEKQGFRERIGQHVNIDHPKWRKLYDPKNEQLVYAIAPKVSDLLQTIESALICENQPEANTEYKNHYQGEYDEVTVTCGGAMADMIEDVITAKV